MQQNMKFIRKLPIPMELKERYPLREEYAAAKRLRDEEIANVFRGKDSRLLLIIGPCSADREDAVLDYTARLAELQEQVKDKLLIIPRIYTNKPRTTGDGYKGMLHQPNPHGKEDLLEGIIAIRRLHTRVIEQTGLFCADEMLYPSNYRYLSDLLSYVAVGARSVENQEHRLASSGIDVPVGMKNPTAGDISVMLNAITAATHPHSFVYRGWECVSSGNPLAHAILRGFVNDRGQSFPNYHRENLLSLYEQYTARNLPNPSLIVDVNHANSGKRHLEQPRICRDILRDRESSPEIASFLRGFMIESYLEDGSQGPDGEIYGKSITDPCLGWEKTKALVFELAEML